MKSYKNLLIHKPLLGVIATIAVFVLSRYAVQAASSDPTAKLWLLSIHRYIASFLLIVILSAWGWAKPAGITRPVSEWRRLWWLAGLPITLLALINLTSIEFDTLTFGLPQFAAWLSYNLGIGLFEEVLLRGFGFYVLYRAWGTTRGGLFKAAVVHALIFGLLHYLNLLTGSSFLAVSSQVIWAALLAIGFAGVVAFSRTIWPAVFAHAIIDAFGSVDEFFGPKQISSSVADKSLEDVLTIVMIVFVVATLPGLWLLFKADIAASPQQSPPE